jgi:hypothetical protein
MPECENIAVTVDGVTIRGDNAPVRARRSSCSTDSPGHVGCGGT